MAIAIASTAVTTGTGVTGTLVSPSFTPAANSLIVVLANMGWSTSAATASIASSPSLTWTTAVASNDITSNSNMGACYIFYTYQASSPGSMTVTTTHTMPGGGGKQQLVMVLSGANSNQSGAASQALNNSAGTAHVPISITPTTLNSLLVGSAQDGGAADTWATDANTTLIPVGGGTGTNAYVNTTDLITVSGFYLTSLVSSLTATQFGGTFGGVHSGHGAALEILPAGVNATPVQKAIIARQAVNRASTY